MKFVLSMLFALSSGLALPIAAVASENSVPSSCQSVVVKDDSVMLTTKKPLLVMIHNVSNTDLWITHPVSEPHASAGWSSRLQANHWSALSLDKEAFELSCIESKPGHEQQVPCSGVISVCQWSKVLMPAQGGTYWAAENMPLPTLTEHLRRQGFQLPNPAQ